MNTDSKIAIVTGGTRGIGRAIAKALANAGATVAITARNEQDLTSAVSRINEGASGSVAGYGCDVRDYDRGKEVFADVANKFGGLDILINNAGVGLFEPVETMSPEIFRTVLETNLFGVFYCCHEAIPLMKQRGGGYIINISSLAGANAHPRL